VLLPGLDGTGDLFAPVVDALGPNVPTQIVRYPLSHASDYATCEAIARAALPTDRPYVLLGESFSGPIAVSIAATAPPGLRGLILCSTFIAIRNRIYGSYNLYCRYFPSTLHRCGCLDF
jgi:pimeloyl-ACP methyl ester carboxylesterase